jgi:crotonobetainyl-CoA:carnitine CoA-transferase CaiB-like acyl-CoA transferase
MTVRPGPLAGIKVLDLSAVLVGPACTWRLAEYGAEIIKIEAPSGDLMRTLGGPSPTGRHGGTYLHLNRGKRSVGLNLKHKAAQDVVHRLADRCDVVVSNMRPDALARLGLDADSLRAARPRLIHCLITGFGPGGPYRGEPAYDSVLQGVSGVAGLAGQRDGKPVYAPLLICDHVVGEITAGAIMAALIERGRTGQGAALEVPMHETMAALVLQEHLGQQSFAPPLGPPGDLRTLDPGNAPLPTADGWISVTANTDAQVASYLRAVGRADKLDDPAIATVAGRAANVQAWYKFRAECLLGRTTAEWLVILRAADVPAMPCHTLATLLEDPHLTAVGLLGRDTHPTEGAIRTIRSTVLRDGALPAPGAPAQPIGWDTRAVLGELGIEAEAIEGLFASGAAHEARG